MSTATGTPPVAPGNIATARKNAEAREKTLGRRRRRPLMPALIFRGRLMGVDQHAVTVEK